HLTTRAPPAPAAPGSAQTYWPHAVGPSTSSWTSTDVPEKGRDHLSQGADSRGACILKTMRRKEAPPPFPSRESRPLGRGRMSTNKKGSIMENPDTPTDTNVKATCAPGLTTIDATTAAGMVNDRLAAILPALQDAGFDIYLSMSPRNRRT